MLTATPSLVPAVSAFWSHTINDVICIDSEVHIRIALLSFTFNSVPYVSAWRDTDIVCIYMYIFRQENAFAECDNLSIML